MNYALQEILFFLLMKFISLWSLAQLDGETKALVLTLAI